MIDGPLPRLARGAVLFPLLVAAACGSPETTASRASSEPAPAVASLEAPARPGPVLVASPPAAPPAPTAAQEFSDCDPLVPENCMYPFPNNFWLRDDPTMPSGHRVHFGPNTLPKDRKGKKIDPSEWNGLDGFPVIPAIKAYFKDVALDNVPHHWDIARSLEPDSPTVLMDAETGELLPHFAELNESGSDPRHKAFMIWPIQKLENARRYIVAIRDLEDTSGNLIQPSEAFRALRDQIATTNYDIEGRRTVFEDIFTRLEEVGVTRGDLQLAWDFTTASRENLTGRLLYARNDALARIPAGGPRYRITSIEDEFNSNIFRKITGEYRVPLYVDSKHAGAMLVLDENGNPEYQGDAWAKFTVLIPRNLILNGQAGRIVQYGHGLLGGQGEVESGYLGEQANRYGYVLCATDWWGMSTPDAVTISLMLLNDLSDFKMIPDRSLQGMVNALLLMRMMMGDFAKDEMVTFDGRSVIDPSRRSYYGNSQGGILGGVYMALTTDVQYGTLGVAGAPYGLLLPRSVDFTPYYKILQNRYPDGLDQIMILSIMQMLWDRAEPSAYLDAITQRPFPNTPSHRVLFQYGLGDAQVSWLGLYVMARSVDAAMHTPYVGAGNEEVYGIDFVSGPVERSIAVGYDFAVPAPPLTNTPPGEETDTHEKPRRERSAQDQMEEFFRTGVIKAWCDGACDPN